MIVSLGFIDRWNTDDVDATPRRLRARPRPRAHTNSASRHATYLLRFDDFIAHDVKSRVVLWRCFGCFTLGHYIFITFKAPHARRGGDACTIHSRESHNTSSTHKSPSSTRRSDRRSYNTTRVYTCRTACSLRARHNGYICDDSWRTRGQIHHRDASE